MRYCSVVSLFARRGAAIISRNSDRPAVRIEKELGPVKAEPACRIEWSVGPKSVNLSRLNAWHEDVPIVISAMAGGVDLDYSRGTRILVTIEHKQLNARCAPGVQAEIDAPANQCGTERTAPAGTNGRHRGKARLIPHDIPFDDVHVQPLPAQFFVLAGRETLVGEARRASSEQQFRPSAAAASARTTGPGDSVSGLRDSGFTGPAPCTVIFSAASAIE